MYHLPSLDYMGSMIVPVVTQDPSGFRSAPSSRTKTVTDKQPVRSVALRPKPRRANSRWSMQNPKLDDVV